MKKEGLKIGLLYLALHNQLTKKYAKEKEITRKEFFIKLGRHHMIPKNLRHIVIKEMEEMELIKVIDRDKIEILDGDLDLERDSHKIFKMVGLF